jgi:murein DD-endopeptidase MepM/ murein hydrolase activator NlpD
VRLQTCTLTLVVAALVGGAAKADSPWKARTPPFPPPPAHQLVDVDRWPEEPAAPSELMPERFREALSYLCRKPVDKTPAYEILASARESGVDPFLLAALVSERSRCREKLQSRGGYGLLLVQPEMYRGSGLPDLPVHEDEWKPANLLSARANVSVGARLLRMWQEQHDNALDLTFGGVPHRSAISHFYWGDEVASSGSEDLVLTARRRLLARYLGHVEEPRATESSLGLAVVPPLEAAPRVATSGPGDDRDRGARSHRGLDLVASPGEPIRSIADGAVIFAGVNLLGNTRYGPIAPSRIASYAGRSLGRGGIYLCIRHTPSSDENTQRVVTCYMHLDRYFVAAGEEVRAGQTIGLVGRSGVRRSPPHLHFEVRVDNRIEDPSRLFTESVIPPADTLTYRYNLKAKKARARARLPIPTSTIQVAPGY